MNLQSFSDQYLNILNTDLAGLNLTRILDPVEFYNKQILDSVIPLRSETKFSKLLEDFNLIIDIGFGGGFPIVPLAKQLQNKQFVGFEARSKKVEAVKLISKKLGLHNTSLHHQRIEEVLLDRPCLITLKAVGKVNKFLSMINTSERTVVCFYKGPSYNEEEDLNNIPKGWNFLGVDEVKIPETEGRYLLYFENVPRGTKHKKLKKLSEIIQE